MERRTMTLPELENLRGELKRQFDRGATTDEIEQWADAYTFARRDLIELLRLMLERHS